MKKFTLVAISLLALTSLTHAGTTGWKSGSTAFRDAVPGTYIDGDTRTGNWQYFSTDKTYADILFRTGDMPCNATATRKCVLKYERIFSYTKQTAKDYRMDLGTSIKPVDIKMSLGRTDTISRSIEDKTSHTIEAGPGETFQFQIQQKRRQAYAGIFGYMYDTGKTREVCQPRDPMCEMATVTQRYFEWKSGGLDYTNVFAKVAQGDEIWSWVKK